MDVTRKLSCLMPWMGHTLTHMHTVRPMTPTVMELGTLQASTPCRRLLEGKCVVEAVAAVERSRTELPAVSQARLFCKLHKQPGLDWSCQVPRNNCHQQINISFDLILILAT
ncbi:uncharacterized protein LOC143449991 isoform X2 [Clavelina lepadiformis]|uniref:uncharacterized protein LOC143449991 isoform X2 n=1 Tax=Clavelina lepadiformis TaxID=159417 RepID=UPI004042574A